LAEVANSDQIAADVFAAAPTPTEYSNVQEYAAMKTYIETLPLASSAEGTVIGTALYNAYTALLPNSGNNTALDYYTYYAWLAAYEYYNNYAATVAGSNKP